MNLPIYGTDVGWFNLMKRLEPIVSSPSNTLMVLRVRFAYSSGRCRSSGAVRPVAGVGSWRGVGIAKRAATTRSGLSLVARSHKAIKRSPAALMMSIDIQIAIWLAVRSLGRARSLGCCAASSVRLFLAERGKLDRLGRGLPLHDLALGHGLAVPLAVRHVLHLHAVGRCAGWRLDDGATTSSGALSGSARGGGLPAVRLGTPPVSLTSIVHWSVNGRCDCDGTCRLDRPSSRPLRVLGHRWGLVTRRPCRCSATVDSAAIRCCASACVSDLGAVRDCDRQLRSACCCGTTGTPDASATISTCSS